MMRHGYLDESPVAAKENMSVATPARRAPDQLRSPKTSRNRGASPRSAPQSRKTARETALAVVPWAIISNLAVAPLLFALNGGFNNVDSLTALFTMIGRLSGALAVSMCLTQLVLMARIPWLDRALGRDTLIKYHRVIGQSTYYFLLSHVIFTALGYSRLADITFLEQAYDLIFHTKWVLYAAGAFVCFTIVAISSIREARKKVQYETWHFMHFYAYLGIALAVPHQIFAGTTFTTTVPSQIYWALFYCAAIGLVVTFRFLMPLRSLLQFDLRVDEIVRESSDTISIYITGKNLSGLKAEAGQYFNWRFLDRDNWTAAHPFSLSAAPPRPGRETYRDRLRITVKQVGLGTRKLEHLEAGTRILAEGPYGAFTPSVRTRARVLLIAGGVGVTPIRALIESLPARSGDISMIYRAHSKRDLVLIEEIRELAVRRRIFVHVVLGGRDAYPPEFPPLGADHLGHVAPDVADRDVYICGSESLTQHVLSSLDELGVPRRQVHYESFSF